MNPDHAHILTTPPSVCHVTQGVLLFLRMKKFAALGSDWLPIAEFLLRYDSPGLSARCFL